MRRPVIWKAIAALLLCAIGSTAVAAQGITDNSGQIPTDQAFFAFEVESVLESLKDEPTWDELEQMLDNPYQFALEPNVLGNYQHWPSYRSTQARRRSFIYRNAAGQPCAPLTPGCNEVPLQGLIIHPPNFNYQSGEELRLLNPQFTQRNWPVPDELRQRGTSNTWLWTYRSASITDGAERVEADEVAIDYNSPIRTDFGSNLTTALLVPASNAWNNCSNPIICNLAAAALQVLDAQAACIISTEPIPVEGAQVCGGDPGEPGYLGFGVPPSTSGQRAAAYSTPALPLPAAFRPPGVDPRTVNIAAAIQAGARLTDPAGCAQRNLESPGSCVGNGQIVRLRKPTLRATPSSAPDYDDNIDPNNVEPSNENDYYRGNNRAQKLTARAAAAALGKALFWEMQVGSDTVQACASCHFHAGADDRTKNQTNPNHVGADTTLQLHGGVQNTDLVPTDFPFHKCGQDDLDPSCHVNDVASSMGVRYRLFQDIPPIGTGANQSFGPPDAFGIRTLLPDLGNDPQGGQATDPIPLFQGLRRVEPRNTPTLFNAAMNFDNFWDGRARHDFNGGSVFGPSDPQRHVWVGSATGPLTATRQIIRFTSLASLATGPALSEFEMSFDRRNWAKIGKKLLQGVPASGGATAPGGTLRGRVTPLANQLVSGTDSVLGIYSNQGGPGNVCATLSLADRVDGWTGTAPDKPGLCISYPGLIRQAFYPALWQNGSQHLNGCYTDGDLPPALHRSPQCAAGSVAIPVLAQDSSGVVNSSEDPFDHYVLTAAAGAALATDTNQFSQMEANMPLFFGLAVHAWGLLLIPDDTPFDRFMDVNPDAYVSFGESGEPSLVPDMLNCSQTNGVQPCFSEVGNFKRDPNVVAQIGCTGPLTGCTSIPAGGTRAGGPDPLLGLDLFLGSNISLKNPNFRSLRCGECHAQGTFTDNTFGISHQTTFNDWVVEFREGQPGNEIFPEPLGRSRTISGFALEGELTENAQDAIERNISDLCVVAPCQDAYGNPVPGGITGGFPQGQSFFDNGVYNLGVTPIANDVGRGGKDAFGWPLSLSYLMLKNLGGVSYSPGGDDPNTGFAQPPGGGIPLPNFDPSVDPTGGGLLEETAQDQSINPGFEEEPGDPQLPAYLAPWASNVNVGDEVQQDEVFTGLNTLAQEPQLEGFIDNFGPFNPAATLGENMNSANGLQMGTWPNVNRVNVQGAFKAAPLRHVARTGPYFHDGGKLTLRQVLDFYLRGGDFPRMNAAHRDFLVVNGNVEDEALGGCLDATTRIPVAPNPEGGCPAGSTAEFTEQQKEEIRTAVIDFLLELTDERVDYQRAPFDQVEIFVPLDGTAPDNGSLPNGVSAGRQGFINNLANGLFLQVPETGASGKITPLTNFLNVTEQRKFATQCAAGEINHYCP
jgi:cytochrome c peroxidase